MQQLDANHIDRLNRDGCDVIFNITEGGLELFFFVLEGGTV